MSCVLLSRPTQHLEQTVGETEPANAILRSAEREHRPDDEERESGQLLRQVAEGEDRTRESCATSLNEEDDQRSQGDRRDAEPDDHDPCRPAVAHVPASPRCQNETWAGCIVSATTVPQLGGQLVEVDLLAQPGAERLECSLRVVAVPVEAPVDKPLHA